MNITYLLFYIIVLSTVVNVIVHGKEGFTWKDKL
jgi:hypothetical protein